MSSARFVVFGFSSTHDAIRAERLMRAEQLDAILIPTPSALGSLCGLALRAPTALGARVSSLLAQDAVIPTGSIEIDDRVLD